MNQTLHQALSLLKTTKQQNQTPQTKRQHLLPQAKSWTEEERKHKGKGISERWVGKQKPLYFSLLVGQSSGMSLFMSSFGL